MYLIAIAWMYVVLMMTLAEATSANGTWLGALFTFALYGALPLSIVLYILGTPARRRARQQAQAAEMTAAATDTSGLPPDGRLHAAGDAVSAERKET